MAEAESGKGAAKYRARNDFDVLVCGDDAPEREGERKKD